MSLDYLAEDYRNTADLLRKYAYGTGQWELFRAVCSNNLNIILAALDLAEAVAPRDASEENDEP